MKKCTGKFLISVKKSKYFWYIIAIFINVKKFGIMII